ncbi:MAG TPA: dipeptidase [Actinomycetota bacterium]|nr:dipeptidase [Actinomycetota bacterium]
MSHELRRAVEAALPGVRGDLDRLIRIPSVSAPGFDPDHVRRSAEATAEILDASGLKEVRFLEVDGTPPAVLGRAPAPEGAPTVVLYAHHDVQPPGDEADWNSPPFEPVERDGRLYGRGSSDDKGGIAMHAAALRAFDGRPPVGVTVFVEGEEEIGSPNLVAFLDRYRDELAGDVIVLADSSNWRVGEPAITTSLRGLVDCVVEVRTLDHGVHSGFLGGVFPDALTVLARVLATLHDDRGEVVIPGLVAGEADELDLSERELREQVSALPSVRTIGEGSLTARMWRRPAISVLAIDAPSVREASNTLIPSARAKVSLRLAPGDDPARAMDALVEHLEANAPWGAEVRVERGAAARPFDVRPGGPVFRAAEAAFEEAWGRAPLYIGQGGTIPFVADFADTYPDAAILLTGVADPDSRAHGANESVAVSELERAAIAEALLLERLAP